MIIISAQLMMAGSGGEKKSFTNNYQQLKLIYEKKKQGISPGIQLKIGSTARPIADPFAGTIVQRPIN